MMRCELHVPIKNNKYQHMKNFFYSLLLTLFSILTSCAKDDSSETTNSAQSPTISDIYPLSGLAGTKVFIKGTNLTADVNNPQVFLNNTSITPINSSDTKVEFSSPQGGTSGLIELQFGANAQKTKGYNYTYTTKAPSWKILFLIVQKLDYTYTELPSNTVRHVVGDMSAADQTIANDQFIEFATHALPALSSGMQTPTYEIRKVPVLQHSWTASENNSANNNNLFPRQNFLGVNDDVNFDAIILVYPKNGIDQNNNNQVITFCNYGQTPNNWKGRTYATFPTNYLSVDNVNIFTHEFGHSITFYYNAVSPGCLGSKTNAGNAHIFNHTGGNGETRYVRFQTKKQYLLGDDDKILNSLYNYYNSFSHDYYSGFTTDPDFPSVAIGVGQAQWDLGGAVSK
jgi:hypothetical protein